MTALAEAIDQAGVPVREIHSGDRLLGGRDCKIEVLHPPRRGLLGGDNVNSIVLAIEYSGRRILLPGDLEPPGLSDVLAEEPWDCDVLMAPHHGSRRSDPAGLAGWCSPEWAINPTRPSPTFRCVLRTASLRKPMVAVSTSEPSVLRT